MRYTLFIMKKTFILFTILTLCLTFFAMSSCKSLPEIPNDMTQAQLIQKGQNAFSAGDYKVAEYYYQTSIQRYGNNTESYIESKYELGHLYLKTKDYDKAEEAFNEILELYDYAAAGDLPASYKKLANIGLGKIPKKNTQKE